jgi:hypothetical protein
MADNTREIAAELTTTGALSAEVRRAHRRLLDNANDHLSADRYQEAILIAQAAAEACSARAITALLAKHPEPLKEALSGAFGADSNYNLTPAGARKVWTFLTRDVITVQPFWADYKAHTERRNDSAHNTAFDMDKAQSQESVRAATAFVDHVETVTGGILGPNAW